MQFLLQCWHANARADSKKPGSEPGPGSGVPASVPRRATESEIQCFALEKSIIPNFLLSEPIYDRSKLGLYVAPGGASTTATGAPRARFVLV